MHAMIPAGLICCRCPTQGRIRAAQAAVSSPAGRPYSLHADTPSAIGTEEEAPAVDTMEGEQARAAQERVIAVKERRVGKGA